jgi:membrane-associated phospholipid phosphatase
MTALLLPPAPHAEPARPDREPARAPALAWLLTGLVGCATAFAAAYWAFVQTLAGQQVENAVVRNAQSGQVGELGLSAGALGVVDVRPWLATGLLAVLVIAVARRRFAAGASATALLFGSLVVAQYLKLTALTRPALDTARFVAHHNSFPSGHVTAATAALLALAFVLPRRVRPWVLVPGAGGVGWVGYATVVLGWHRPSDAIGGSLLVAAGCCAVLAVLACCGVVHLVPGGPGGAVGRHGAPGEEQSVLGWLAVLAAPVVIVAGGYFGLGEVTGDAAAAAVVAALASGSVVVFMACLLWRVEIGRTVRPRWSPQPATTEPLAWRPASR